MPRTKLTIVGGGVALLAALLWLLGWQRSEDEAPAELPVTGTLVTPGEQAHLPLDVRVVRESSLSLAAPETGDALPGETEGIRATGRLVFEDRRPAADIELVAVSRANVQQRTTVRSAADGRFAFRLGRDWQGGFWPADGRCVLAGTGSDGMEGLLAMAQGTATVHGDGAVHFGPSDVDIDFGEVVVCLAASAQGIVRTRAGPLAGAAVDIARGGVSRPHEQARSGADGVFRFAGLGTGDYTIAAWARGCFRGELRIGLAPGEQREDLVLELGQGESVAGLVVDDRGDPVAGALVKGWSERLDTTARSGVHAWDETDASGAFTLTRHASGKLSVYAEKRGYDTASLPDARPDAGLLRLAMQRQGSLSGFAFDAAGKPLAGSRVWAARGDRDSSAIAWSGGLPQTSPSLEYWPGACTAADGSFRLPLVPAGELAVHAIGKHTQVDRHGVLVQPGQETRGVELRMVHAGELEVMVLDPDQRPLVGAKVGISRRRNPAGAPSRSAAEEATALLRAAALEEEPLAATRTDGQGRAVVTGLPTGELVVRASHARWVAAAAERVALTGRATVKIHLLRGGTAELRTVDGARAPVASQRFAITHEETKATRRGVTDANGRATVPGLPAGPYRAVLHRTSSDSMAMLLSGTTTIPASSTAFRVVDGETVEVFLERTGLVHLGGRVSAAGGSAVANATVTVLRNDGKWSPVVGTGRTQPDGRYEVADLEPGAHVLCVKAAGATLAQRVPLEIPIGVPSHRQDVVLEGGCVLVQVADEQSGEPVAGAVATVSIQGSPGRSPVDLLGDDSAQAAESRPTSEIGECELELPAGRYELRIGRPGYAAAEGIQSDIRPGERHTVRVRLASCARLSVAVRLPGGERARWFEIEYRREGASEARIARTHGGLRELESLGRGTWLLRARALGAGANPTWGPEQRVELGARGQQELELLTAR